MTLLSRDEEGIIASVVNFYLKRGADHIIIAKNASSDGTLQLLLELVADSRVGLLFEPNRDCDQAIWDTRMARIQPTVLVSKFTLDHCANSDLAFRRSYTSESAKP